MRAISAANKEESDAIRRALEAGAVANEVEQATTEVIDDVVTRVSMGTTHAEKIIREAKVAEQRLFSRSNTTGVSEDGIILSSDDDM